MTSTLGFAALPLVAALAACVPEASGPGSSSGGSMGSGGSLASSGGVGAPGSGGSTGTGGTVNGSGGTSASGGSSSGGATGSGGTIGSGGASTGGATGSGGRAGGATGSGGRAGGATGSGGAAGGATMGTAGAGGPSLCPVAGTTLCDGFEDIAPGAAGSDWTLSQLGGATMTLDTTKGYRGSKSMHFVAGATSGPTAFIVEKKTFTGTTKATNNDFWGRYFILSGVAAASGHPAGHAVYGTLGGTGMPAGADGLFHFVGGSRAVLQAEIRNSGDAYTDSMASPNAKAPLSPPFPLAADGWQCWEFHVQPDDSFSFYINGPEVEAMKITAGKAVKSGANFVPLPMMTSLSIGWKYFGGGANSGWIDEVAVGPNRIGCGS